MGNTNTTETSGAATDHASARPQRMSELLPLVARQLRSHGVTNVHVNYEGKGLAFIFIGTAERPLPKSTAVVTTSEITQTLQSILERRYPGATKTDGASGYFEWDLANDTLLHEHSVTHHGI